MATQKGRNWSSGDIVTAANLSSIERGVSAVAEEYTPTTWANGNTVTAAALNNIEQGIVNGGGSSDFSTAEITLNDDSNEVTIYGAFTFENLQMPPANGTRSSNRFSNTVVLYKGSAIIEIDGVPEGYSVSTSGDISQLGGRSYAITGDCTITIS